MAYNILVADDAKMNRKLLIELLKNKLDSTIFYEAINGIEVLEIVEEHDIDLILLDLIMPEKDGYETLKTLKINRRTTDIPVIVNSAINDIDSIEEILKDGATDYFTKPLSKRDMDIILPLKAKNALILYEHKKTIEKLNKAFNDELKNANAFQNIMLPKSKNLKNIDLFIKFQPSLGIGGDLFDCVEVDGKVWFVIADVTGHGIAAGMASSMVKVMFRSNLEKPNITPSGVLSAINKTVFSIFDFGASINFVMFTAFIGCIDGDQFTYSNAGQPYPLLIKAKANKVNSLDINGLLIGLIETATFDERIETLDVGDTIFVYTDGLFSSGKKSDFKNWTLVEYFTQVHKDLAISDEAMFLNKAFNHFKLMHMDDYGDFTDDVAMMMLKLK